MAIESLAPSNHKQLDGYPNQGALFRAPEKEEQNFKEHDFGLAKICEENSVSLAVNGDTGLRSDRDVASPSASSEVEDLSTETAHDNHCFLKGSSAKKRRLNPGLIDGAVVQNGDKKHRRGVNPDFPLKDSEIDMVETRNLGLHFSQQGTQSELTKEELERKENRKLSNRDSAKRARFSKQQENQMLLERAKLLKREISELTNGLLFISEECQEVNEENNSLMEEVEETYGPDAISDLRARNPASTNYEKRS